MTKPAYTAQISVEYEDSFYSDVPIDLAFAAFEKSISLVTEGLGGPVTIQIRLDDDEGLRIASRTTIVHEFEDYSE